MLGVITVKLTPTNVYTRWPCVFCARCSENESALAVLLEDGEWIGIVCPQCLEDSDLRTTMRAKASTMRAEAARLRAAALKLDTLADNIPALPTMAEWRATAEAAEAHLSAGHDTPPDPAKPSEPPDDTTPLEECP